MVLETNNNMDMIERIEVLDEIDALLSSTKVALQRDENIDEALYNLNLIVQLMTSMVRSNERNN